MKEWTTIEFLADISRPCNLYAIYVGFHQGNNNLKIKVNKETHTEHTTRKFSKAVNPTCWRSPHWYIC